jgi:hypothetical protein
VYNVQCCEPDNFDADPDPDPDLISEKKVDPFPDPTPEKNADPDLDPAPMYNYTQTFYNIKFLLKNGL